MPEHAGFAVAIAIRERVLNDAILVAYADGTSVNRLVAPIPGGPPDVDVDWFLEAPTIRIDEQSTSHLVIELSGWGPLLIDFGGTPHSRDLKWRLRLRVEATFVVQGTAIALQPAPDDVVVSDWDYEVLAGGPFPPDVDLFLSGGVFRNRLRDSILLAIDTGLLPIPPIDVSFLGPIVQVANMETGTRVADGTLVVGLDIESDTITTKGDADLLGDFARTNDIATVVNPVAAPALIQGSLQQIRNTVAAQGATLERLDLAVEEGLFRIDGRASKTGGAVEFSLGALPVLFDSRDGAFLPFRKQTVVVKARRWPALTFRPVEVEVDVDRADWLVVLEVLGALLTGAVIPLIIESFVREVAAQVAVGIKTAPTQTPVPRVRVVPPTTPGGTSVRVEVAEFEIHAGGVFTGVMIDPEIRRAGLVGLTSIRRTHIHEPLEYRVALPTGALAVDPKLRIRWSILDLATGDVLRNEDGRAFGRQTLRLTPADLGTTIERFGVMVRVYRALGPEITELLNEGITLEIRDPLPAGTYVRWHYDVKNPQVQFDDERDAWWYDSPSELVVRRWSAIHRLDEPCSHARDRSRYTYRTELLDELPFPLVQILDARNVVCEYCFFGGPGKLLPSL